MARNVTIYHNPRCTKSRQTLELLEEKGIEPNVIQYLDTPPSKYEIRKLLKLLDLEARELMRTNEAEYKENALNNPELSKEQLIDAMVSFPKLIQRPIVVVDEVKAAIGRPPENVLEIL